jgi:flagellar P-ring protein precursor FlgI
MRKTFAVILFSLALATTTPAFAVKVADITRIGGQRRNFLIGTGLVIGLKGTGDGSNPATLNPLRELLAKFDDPVTAKELTASNVALVTISASVPANGLREGDELDVHVNSINGASSLRGGRLFVCPLSGATPKSPPVALAQGAVELEDPTVPTAGVVKKGAVMEVDMAYKFIDHGRFWLVLEDASASWTNANYIAKTINEAEGADGSDTLATAVDPKNVQVIIPKIEQERPDSFMARVQRLNVPMLPSEARVQINERTGTLIVTGDVEISPVVISHRGLTISTIEPTPVPTPRAPVVSNKDIVSLDTTNQGGAKLQDLVNALEQLKVPTEDRITIVKELHKTGKLHAKLIME